MQLPFNLVYPALRGYVLECDDNVLSVLSTKQNAKGKYLSHRTGRGYVLTTTEGERLTFTMFQLRGIWGVLTKKFAEDNARFLVDDIRSKSTLGEDKQEFKATKVEERLYDLIQKDNGIELYNATLANIVKHLQNEYGYNDESDDIDIEKDFRIIPAGYGAIKAKIEVKITMDLVVEE